jgi:pyrroline-5-carboxylate reductase
VAGLLALGLPAAQIIATSRRPERRAELSTQFGIRCSDDNLFTASQADIVLLAAKPLQLADLCRGLSQVDHRSRLFISVAAGIEVSQIRQWLAQDVAIVRAMPNTPAALQAAATGLYTDALTTSTQRQVSEQLFSAIGVWVWLTDEKWMNWVTALSGSGPAYFYQLMADMVAAAVAAGFPADAAQVLVKQTCLGAAQLATQANADTLAELIRRVRSPGGTTERALNTLVEHDFAGIIATMLQTAEQRGREMSDALKTP